MTIISGTYFFHKAARHKQEFTLTPDTLVEKIETFHRPRKEDLQWLKLALFGMNATAQGSLRHDANVLAITGVEADYDGEKISFDDAASALEKAGIEAIIYTSPSHREDKPRWRVIAPCSRQYPPGEREKFLARLNGLFAGALGRESFVLSQSYFFGYVGESACTPATHRARYVAGAFIDLRSDLDTGAIGKHGGGHKETNGEWSEERFDFEGAVEEIVQGGSFHDPIKRVAASMFGRGLTRREIEPYLNSIRAAAVLRRPDLKDRNDDIPRLLDWLEEREAKKLKTPPPSPQENTDIAKETTGPEPANIVDWDLVPPPEPQWIVPQIIPVRQVTLFSGEGAAGKSTIALHLAAATALGQGWLISTPEQGPAFFIDAEDDLDIIHWRLEAVRRLHRTTFTELHQKGLRIWSLAGKDALFTRADKNRGSIEPTPLYRFFLKQAHAMKPKIIVIASSANVFSGNENDRPQVTLFVNMLKAVAIAAEGAVVLVSHPSLQGINSGTGLSGSTQWHNAVRARMVLHGSDDEPNLRELEFQKNQYGPLSEKVVLEYNTDARMFLVKPGMSPTDKAARELKAETVFLDLIKHTNAINRIVSDRPQSRNYAPRVFLIDQKAQDAKLKKDDLAGAMERLFAKGAIRMEPYGAPSDKTSKIMPSQVE